MNHRQLLERWVSEKHIYEAWGAMIVEKICSLLEEKGENIDCFFKVSPSYRLKDDNAFVDKAFYRENKSYEAPYEQIQDKVGVRFVVLLLRDLNIVCDVLTQASEWTFEECRHFTKEREDKPEFFTYQSVHYVLNPSRPIQIDELEIPTSICCEVQVRTLLQHAHAELTHDAIYKAKKQVEPKINRTVARSMALIETTDEYFEEVVRKMGNTALVETNTQSKLDQYYFNFTQRHPQNQKSTILIWDTFENLIDENLIEEIKERFSQEKYSFLRVKVSTEAEENTFYAQSITFFVYWLLIEHKNRVIEDWPLDTNILSSLAIDVGVSIGDN